MMPRLGLKGSIPMLGFIALIGLTSFMTACPKIEKPPEIKYLETTTLPSKLAVMPTSFLPSKKDKTADFSVDPNSEKGKFVGELVRGVIHNQLTGKGFDMAILSQVDKNLNSIDSAQLSVQQLCDKLGVQGLVYPEIAGATMVTGVAYDLFKIDAGIRLLNNSGTELGSWKDSASKRKIAIPTSPIGVATTIAGAFLSESARKQMRLVIYDWGWKVTQFVPDSPLGKTMPEVVSVDSNIDKGTFAAGAQIIVEVVAEKNLTCTFDLGHFKKSLPMSDNGDGAYKGVYVVQEGDKISNQSLNVHLVRSNGVERIWLETGGMVTIDGELPPSPEEIEAQASRSGVSLSWVLPQGEDLKEFIVEKSETAVGTFSVVGTTKDLKYLDTEVAQGKTYYYHVRSVDLAGNRNTKPSTVQVIMPRYDEVSMTGPMSGTLVSGIYRVKGEGTISTGGVLSIGAGAKFIMEPGARLLVNGTLKVNGSRRRPVLFSGEQWNGIVVGEHGEAEFEFASLRGCKTCVDINGGNVIIHGTSLKGQQGDGVVLRKDGVLSIKEGRIQGCKRSVAIESGRATVEKTTLTHNAIGIDIQGGILSLNQSNVYGNSEKNIRTRGKLVIENNYLGATTPKELGVEGDVLVKSVLDAPFPHGRKVVLVETEKISPAVLEKRFENHKQNGTTAFKQRRYGDAYQSLTKALKIREDKEVYLYLAYTQSSLGEDERMVKTLDRAIEAFPYEVRLYQIYVKYLAAHGHKKKAMALLDQAVKLNPEDHNLVFMKQYIESMEQ